MMSAVPFRLVAAFAIAAAAAALALAVVYEGPRSFQAAELLEPSQIKGPHHQVAPTVETEGYLHVFDITSDYGPLEAEGMGMLLVRLHEVSALVQLDEVSKSEVFLKAAGTSVLNVGKGVASVVKDPEGTVKGIGGGVKRFGTNLGRRAKGTGDKAATADAGMAYSISGINSGARKWAQKVGVDPYTTNPILKKALTDLGQIDLAGSIAGKIVTPIPQVVKGTASVGDLVWSKDPEEVLKVNEQKLAEMGVGGGTIEELRQSKGFTLTLHTRLASSLREVYVPGCADYAATAAEAATEREAAFFVESAEMLSAFHTATSVVAVLEDSRALVAKTKDGRAVVMLPIDWVRWTEAYDKALGEVEKRARVELGATGYDLRMTGTLSAVAKGETSARGWKVLEKLPTSFEILQARAR